MNKTFILDVCIKYVIEPIIFNIAYGKLTPKIKVGLVSPINNGSEFKRPFIFLDIYITGMILVKKNKLVLK
jgi:hypothetical protein